MSGPVAPGINIIGAGLAGSLLGMSKPSAKAPVPVAMRIVQPGLGRASTDTRGVASVPYSE